MIPPQMAYAALLAVRAEAHPLKGRPHDHSRKENRMNQDDARRIAVQSAPGDPVQQAIEAAILEAAYPETDDGHTDTYYRVILTAAYAIDAPAIHAAGCSRRAVPRCGTRSSTG